MKELLMYDSSEKDGKAEIVMDYVLSWCLRCAADNQCENKPKLHEACRFILGRLMDDFPISNCKILKVEVWKEWEQIDICAEVKIEKASGQIEEHAILIENKYYTGLHQSRDIDGTYRNQLIVYKKKFDKQYKDKFIKHYNVISCISKADPKFEQLFGIMDTEEYKGFQLFSLDELLINMEETESDIYNEFMLENWC